MNIYLKAAVNTLRVLAYMAGFALFVFGMVALGVYHPGILASLLGILAVVIIYLVALQDLEEDDKFNSNWY